jgi:hypothetical protein
MRSKISTIVVAAVAALLVATFAIGQPGGGFSKTAPISGTGSNGSPLKLDVCSSGSGYLSNGTSWACALFGDVTGVTAGSGMTGTATSGAVALEVGCGTGITCGADAVTLNLTAQDCSAGEFFDANTTTGVFTCVAEVGDISGVTAGTGLTGTAASGAVSLDVVATTGGGLTSAADSIGMRTDCSSTYVLAWDGDSWECASAGAAYTAGDGLTLTGNDFDVDVGTGLEISGDSVAIRSDCSNGQLLKWVTGAPSLWTCSDDDGGSVTAGTNIDVSGDTVSVEPTVTLAGEDSVDTLDVLNSATGQNTIPVLIDVDATGSVDIAASSSTYAVDINNSTTCASGCNGDSIVLHNYGIRVNVGTVDGAEVAIWADSGAVDFDETLNVDGAAIFGSTVGITAGLTAADVGAGDDLTVGDDADIDGSLVVGTSSSDVLTVNATTTLVAPITVQDFRGTVLTPATFGVAQHDYDPTSWSTTTVARLTPTANVNLTGLAGGTSGRIITITNVAASFEIVIKHEITSTTTNRFTMPNSRDWTMGGGCSMSFFYDGTTTRWRPFTWMCNSQGEVSTIADSTFGDSTADVMRINSTIKDGSTAPTLSTCGAGSPSVTGGTNAFRITAGTGGITACTATFATTKTATPTCIALIEDVAEEVYISAISATAITITARTGTTDISSNIIDVMCMGDV